MYNTIQRGNQNTTKGKIHAFVVLCSLVLLLIFCLSPFVFAGVKRSRKEKKKETAAAAEAAAAAPLVPA